MGLTLGLRRGRWLVAAGIYALPAIVLLAVTLPHLNQGDFRGDTGRGVVVEIVQSALTHRDRGKPGLYVCAV